jgi:thiamine pyrophosphate-dependent acetolactate synthase large subunit-like protein
MALLSSRGISTPSLQAQGEQRRSSYFNNHRDMPACGAHGFTARQPGELKAALAEVFAIDGPAIVDAVVVANELPNLPHLDLDMIGHFALVKLKEAVLAVTGG